MKKILAVLLAVLMAFSALAVSAMATEAAEATTAVAETEEKLDQPTNFTQLFLAVIFNAFEKVFETLFSLIENIIPGIDLDSTLAGLFGTAEPSTVAA